MSPRLTVDRVTLEQLIAAAEQPAQEREINDKAGAQTDGKRT